MIDHEGIRRTLEIEAENGVTINEKIINAKMVEEPKRELPRPSG